MLRTTHYQRIQQLADTMAHNLAARKARNRLRSTTPQHHPAIVISESHALCKTVERCLHQFRAIHHLWSFQPLHRQIGKQLDKVAILP